MPDSISVALAAAGVAVFAFDVVGDEVSLAPATAFTPDLESPATYARFLDLVHPEDRGRVDAKIRESCAASGPATGYEDELRNVGGTWFATCGNAVATARGKRLVGVLRNHDERRRIDDARLRAIHELSLSARSAEVFISMIAHDLKNPIGVLMSSARTAIDQSAPGELQRKSLERIQVNSERLSRTLQHLREYARQNPAGFLLERKRLDLRSLVERAIATLHADASVTVAVTVTGDGPTTGIWDEARLLHALETLLAEARELAPPHTSTRVQIDGGNPGIVAVEIANDAVISPVAAANAFRPFGGDEAERGLGLFGARQAVVAHGGDVVVRVTEAGTTFTMKLPREVDVSSATRANTWEELTAVEAGPPLVGGVTAMLFGALPLYERAPAPYWKLFERYTALFDAAVDRRIYRGESRTVTEETRAIADTLGSLGAGANEVAEIHARALKQRLHDASGSKAHALVAEGRLLAFEVMGHLVTWYRRRAILNVTKDQGPGEDDA